MTAKVEKCGKKKVSIYVVDDHPVVRKGLSQYINEIDEFIVCGSAGDAETALRELNVLKPDVVIIDISLQGTSGFELTRGIKERHKNMHVLIHSMHCETAYVEKAIRAGADGYVVKSEPIENINAAICGIMKGERFLSSDLRNKLLDILIDQSSGKSIDPVTALTVREFEVFRKIGEGFGMEEIAGELRLSVKTVQTYRERIKEKLGMDKSKDLVHFAYQWVSANK